uniref:Far11/STRP N-terminal domain-containing protein n=1 Tax=Meloidogyne javanica TaxID=6303 RepID=A0A915MBP1_MELJA
HLDLATGLNGVGGSASGTFERRRSRHTATLADNERIRVVLNCIYHMVESLRRAEIVYNSVCLLFEQQNPGYQSPKYTFDLLFDRNIHARLETLRKQFITELEEPLEHSKMPLAIILLDMMPTFVRAKNPHYPIKKVILLCWKVLLTTLGGIEFLSEEKTRKRRNALLEYIVDTQHLKAEERYNKYPFSQKEFIEETPTERLYSRILPEMAEYVIAILKAKNDAVTILSDVLTPETDTNDLDFAHLGSGNVLQDNIRVAIDINRHKEVPYF